jgi:hypothetical protein
MDALYDLTFQPIPQHRPTTSWNAFLGVTILLVGSVCATFVCGMVFKDKTMPRRRSKHPALTRSVSVLMPDSRYCQCCRYTMHYLLHGSSHHAASQLQHVYPN